MKFINLVFAFPSCLVKLLLLARFSPGVQIAKFFVGNFTFKKWTNFLEFIAKGPLSSLYILLVSGQQYKSRLVEEGVRIFYRLHSFIHF